MTAPARPRPVTARRSWLFVDGADETALRAAPASGADVLIQELEDFTPPALRPRARAISPGVLEAWRRAGAVTAVRVNPLEADGLIDLRAVMQGRPDVVLLPKANHPSQIVRLCEAIREQEQGLGLPVGRTEIVPNVELALGLRNTFDIARASARVTACLVASEDMAADLGVERTSGGEELLHVRARFHVECVAASVLSIDCPYTWTDVDGLEREVMQARRLGYRAKSAVDPTHIAAIHDALTPSAEAVREARGLVQAFEAARAAGDGRVEIDGVLVEVPTYLNACRLLRRAEELGVVSGLTQ